MKAWALPATSMAMMAVTIPETACPKSRAIKPRRAAQTKAPTQMTPPTLRMKATTVATPLLIEEFAMGQRPVLGYFAAPGAM